MKTVALLFGIFTLWLLAVSVVLAVLTVSKWADERAKEMERQQRIDETARRKRQEAV